MRAILAIVVILSTAAPVLGQALTNLASLRVRYTTEKNRVAPQGELKAQIDAIDKEIAEANRQGRTGEVRRLTAKGMTLLAGTPWTPALDYQNSLVLRTERTVVDSSVPYALRLEQIYTPAIELSSSLTARVALRRRDGPPRTAGGPPTLGPGIDLASFDSVSRDLRESPYAMDVTLAGQADGAAVIETTVLDGETVVGTASLGVFLQKGLDARLRALETGAAGAAEGLRADILYPGDYIRTVNRGRAGMGTFDVAAALSEAERVLTAAKARKDPFKGRTGDMERHYPLAGANEIMPYRVYVPTAYNGKPTPLVIALHGLGGTEDGFFDNYQQLPPKLSEQHGFLLAAPMGFRVDGFYGSGMMGAADPESRRKQEYSEKDVLEVLRLMKTSYNVDESRIYLIGHSMGAIGTWFLGQKHPDIWAALVSFSGAGTAATVERMQHIPQFVVHGDKDPTVNVNGSRSMVAAMKKLGMAVTYIEVPGGNHTDVVVPNLPAAFDFLAAQKKAEPPPKGEAADIC